MDPRFSEFVTRELRCLWREREAGQEPSNTVLWEKVLGELAQQYRRETGTPIVTALGI